MPYELKIDIQGGEEAKELLRNIDRYLPSITSNKMRKTSNLILKDLKSNMDFFFTAPRGNLKARTKLNRKAFLEYNITMPKYGQYVDSGTRPHKVSKPYLFKPWERRTGIRSLSSAIFNKGTKPTNFIYNTIYLDVPRRMDQFKNEFLAELRKIANKKGGMI